jgi:hypothetical protein
VLIERFGCVVITPASNLNIDPLAAFVVFSAYSGKYGDSVPTFNKPRSLPVMSFPGHYS